MNNKMNNKMSDKIIEKSALKKEDGRKNNGGAREGSGRKPFCPTEAERGKVEAMSSYGVPIDQIAALIRDGIDSDTLRKHFSNELLIGKSNANFKIGETLFRKAVDGDTTALIWWTKTQMGWKETKAHEVTGIEVPQASYPSFDVGKLDNEVLAKILAAKYES